MVGPLKGPVWVGETRAERCDLFAGGVLGDGLGALTHSVFGQFTGKQEADGGLDLPGSDGASLVVVGQPTGLSRDSLKDVVDKRVHDRHGFGRDTSVGVHLFQDLVNVDAVALLPPALPLLVTGAHSLGLAGFLGSFGRNSSFGWHVDGSLKLKSIN